jgi:hypothetical protein
MRKFFKKKSYVLMLCIASVQCVRAEDGPLQATASVQRQWDSNFSRSSLADAEQTTISSAGLSFDDSFGRQRLIAKWRASHYQYDKHPDFDGTTNNAQLSWNGLIGSQINTDVEWLRDSYLVDRLEFFGKDIVNRDDLLAKIGYGNDNKLAFHVGGRKSTQAHTNETRTALDYDENEAFVDAGYQTNSKSSLFIRFRSGARTYTNEPVGVIPDSLNFDYDQIELDGVWALSPKTNISALVASFKRNGSVNDASGSLATFSIDWQATEKIKLNAGYIFKQPAIGETSDSPSQIKNVFMSAAWQYSPRISVASVVKYSIHDYEKVSPELVRTEHLYNFSPLTINYDSGRHWLVRIDSGWRKNESPIASRNYLSRQISAGLFFNY